MIYLCKKKKKLSVRVTCSFCKRLVTNLVCCKISFLLNFTAKGFHLEVNSCFYIVICLIENVTKTRHSTTTSWYHNQMANCENLETLPVNSNPEETVFWRHPLIVQNSEKECFVEKHRFLYLLYKNEVSLSSPSFHINQKRMRGWHHL